jgi:L,D-transpeptidase catalytic domain
MDRLFRELPFFLPVHTNAGSVGQQKLEMTALISSSGTPANRRQGGVSWVETSRACSRDHFTTRREANPMKIVAVCSVLLVAIVSPVAAKEAGVFNTGLPVTLPQPTGLQQATMPTGRPIAADHWIKGAAVRFSVAAASQPDMRLQIELAKNGTAPSGDATATGSIASRTPGLIQRKLANGTYRWWARLYNGNAVSPWKSFSAGVAFGVDTVKPVAPVISSLSDPVQGKVYRSGKVQLNWSALDVGSGIEGYWYRFSASWRAVARHGHMRAKFSGLALKALQTGSYFFAVAARDKAGNWSPVSSYRVRIDSTPPTVSAAGFSTFDFNPRYSTMTMNYRVTEPAWVHIGIYRAGDNHLVRFVVRRATKRNELLHYTWRGRNNYGQIVQSGPYNFFVRTTDAYHNTSVQEYSDLYVINQVIVVSLSQQRLWAYQGHHLFLTSLVTTGNPSLPTPTGTFTILEKKDPFTFISPWPVGDWRYYPPSPVQYAMLFKVGGYYLHDAPWRTVYGPGTNSVPGAPGSVDSGTHGCVNLPLSTASALFQWAPNGTPVRVVK